MVHLLPEGQARETQRASNVLQLCRFLAEPELADALLAQHAELAEQLLAGLAAAMQQKAFQQAAEVRQREAAYLMWSLSALG